MTPLTTQRCALIVVMLGLTVMAAWPVSAATGQRSIGSNTGEIKDMEIERVDFCEALSEIGVDEERMIRTRGLIWNRIEAIDCERSFLPRACLQIDPGVRGMRRLVRLQEKRRERLPHGVVDGNPPRRVLAEVIGVLRGPRSFGPYDPDFVRQLPSGNPRLLAWLKRRPPSSEVESLSKGSCGPALFVLKEVISASPPSEELLGKHWALLARQSAIHSSTVEVLALVSGTLPVYPVEFRIHGLTGTAVVRLSIVEGAVVAATYVSGDILLAAPAIEAARTWVFADNITAELQVSFDYLIEERPEAQGRNPWVEFRLPESVRIVAPLYRWPS